MGEVDPIPDEAWREAWAPAGDAPGGVRFLAFNTVAELAAYGEADAVAAALDEAVAACRAYERLLSRTLPHSDIARLNAAGGAPVEVDARTAGLLRAALGYCAASEGAFDVTVGPAVRLWDFHEGREPDPAALAEAVRHVGWQNLELWEDADGAAGAGASNAGGADTDGASDAGDAGGANNATGAAGRRRCWARLADPEAAVDAGGIAKGWIADELTALLAARGIPGYVVNLGGNVAVGGAKPGGGPWRVGIRDPRDPRNPKALLGAVPLAAGSAVTSGVYERSFTTADGRLCHHVLDPRTGRPAATDVAGVTVVAARSLDAEGFSTTLLALGLERGLALARSRPEISQAFFVGFDGAVTAAR